MTPLRRWATLAALFLVAPADGGWAGRDCAPGSVALREARASLAHVDRLVHGLHDVDAVGPANRALKDLLATPCFLPSEEAPREFPARSALALRTFWLSGGERWLRSYLDRLSPRAVAREIVVPPDLRPAMSAELAPNGVAPELLCPLGDEGCASQARRWLDRAELVLYRTALAPGAMPAAFDPDTPHSSESCWAKAKDEPEARRYREWRICVEEHRFQALVPPLGAFREPDRGWWVVVGGRIGAPLFCRELRAYHLATGSAYVAQSCTQDVLDSEGRRDPAASEATRSLRVLRGTISVDALREAALLAALEPFIALAQIEALAYPLPAGLVPRWRKGTGYWIGPRLAMWGRLHTTELTWRWLIDSREIARGHLTWPPSQDPSGDDYAGQLLREAEADIREGCPVEPAPADLLRSLPSSESLPREAYGELVAALLSPSARSSCDTAPATDR